MSTIILDKEGREIRREGDRPSPSFKNGSVRVSFFSFGGIGSSPSSLLSRLLVLVGRAFAMLALLALGAVATFAGAFLVITLGTLFGAFLITRAVIARKSRWKTSHRGQGQGEQRTQNDFFHDGISSFKWGIREFSTNRDMTRGPVTFFYSRRIPAQERQD